MPGTGPYGDPFMIENLLQEISHRCPWYKPSFCLRTWEQIGKILPTEPCAKMPQSQQTSFLTKQGATGSSFNTYQEVISTEERNMSTGIHVHPIQAATQTPALKQATRVADEAHNAPAHVTTAEIDSVPRTFSSAVRRQGSGEPQKGPAAPNIQGDLTSRKRQADPEKAGDHPAKKRLDWEHYLAVWKLMTRMTEKKRVIDEIRKDLEVESVQFRNMIDKYEYGIKSGHRSFDDADPIMRGGGSGPKDHSVASQKDAKRPAESSSRHPSDSHVCGEGGEGEEEEEEEEEEEDEGKWEEESYQSLTSIE